MESLLSLFNNSFRDCDIFCKDGVISINKLFLGILFPFLSDIIANHGTGDVTIVLPDETTAYIEDKVRHIFLLPESDITSLDFSAFDQEKEQLDNNESMSVMEEDSTDLHEGEGFGVLQYIEEKLDKKLEYTKQKIESSNGSNVGISGPKTFEHNEQFTKRDTKANEMAVGTIFASKEEVKKHVQLFSDSNFSPLVLHRSYTRKNSTHRLNYMCPYGIARKSRSTGKRQSSQKFVGCPVVLNINQQANRTFVVRKADLDHKDHDVGEEVFARYKRKLSKDQEDAVKAFLTTDPSNKEVSVLLADLTGKIYSVKEAAGIVKKINMNEK